MKSQELYDKYKESNHWERHPTIYAKSFVKFLKKNKFSGLIVDIGCGNGRDVNVFGQAGFNVIGIDYSKSYISSCKKEYSEYGFELQNAESLKFKDNSVDAFFMINVIHYVDKEKSIKETFRTLKPKGYFFIHFNMEIIDKNGKIDYVHKEEDVLRLISKFEIIKKRIFERTDYQPVEHKHKIIELILQKP